MIGSLLLALVRYSLLVGLMCGLWKFNSRRWTRLARAYRVVDIGDRVATRTMQTVILVAGDIGWNSYKGIVTIGVTREGLLLRLMPPFSLFHSPLLIPYRDCHVEPRRWYLIGKTVQYSLRSVSDVKIIIHDDLQAWIETQAASLATTPGDAMTPVGLSRIAS